MSWKPSEPEIIDYLYGELSPDKKEEMEKFIKENPEFSKELDSVRLTIGLLPNVEDEEVIPPVPLAGISGNNVVPISSRRWVYPISIAASIAAILLVGYFTNFSISIGGQGFSLGFNKPVKEVNSLDEAQVQALIDKNNNLREAEWYSKLEAAETGFSTNLQEERTITDGKIYRLAQNKPEIDEEQVLTFLSQLKDENEKMMKSYYESSAEEQQEYMRNVLIEFSSYMDQQRQNDMQFIQANMLNLKSSTDQKQEETNKILANIITTVNQNSVGQ